jgi:hypothetical protein
VSDLHIPIPGVGVGAGGVNVGTTAGDLGIPVTPDDEAETEAEVDLGD